MEGAAVGLAVVGEIVVYDCLDYLLGVVHDCVECEMAHVELVQN